MTTGCLRRFHSTFFGVAVAPHLGNEKRYWPLLAKAEELDIPIYLHPTAPMIPELRTFGICLSGPTFGFGTEVMFVFLRMIHRGVFDAFPNLKIILGHFGEAFPFLLDRVDTA